MLTKLRNTVTQGELGDLHAGIERALGRVGVETRPEVGAKLVQLVSNPGAGLRDYAEVIRTDSALTGRLLRVANSAFFAQRKPVTGIERAAVLLGLDRIRAVSLGVCLGRAAAGAGGEALSRRIWGESVFRACLAAEMARAACPALVSEAFVVGLMLDAGVPLLRRLLGEPCALVLGKGLTPTRQFRAEFDSLPYTHVDVVAALVRRWRLPEVLAKPIQWHHTPPESAESADPLVALHRVAYYVGAVHLGPTGHPEGAAPMPTIAGRLLGVGAPELAVLVRRAVAEYEMAMQIFGDIADTMGDLGALADGMHRQLVDLMDEQTGGSVHHETRAAPQRFLVGGHDLEIEPREGGGATAYINDADGNRVMAHLFCPGTVSLEAMLEELGIEAPPGPELHQLQTYLTSLAA